MFQSRLIDALALAAVLVATATVQAETGAAAGERVVLRAAHLVDGTGGPALNNAIVVVQGDRIVAAGTSGTVTIPGRAIVGVERAAHIDGGLHNNS
ncbi:MAG: hypothetical protein M3Y64_00060 [Gemmatimonadota bacterium]|nr:hypothetical protein [Gemmatimonadota bacterium]